jgi:hypothetical protein
MMIAATVLAHRGMDHIAVFAFICSIKMTITKSTGAQR